MARMLSVNDAVLVNLKSANGADNHRIATIKYIGTGLEDYIGIELVEPINNGHNGTINGKQYFQCTNGHGYHTSTSNVIRQIQPYELTQKLQEIISLWKTHIGEYSNVLQQKEDLIEELSNTNRHLQGLLKASQSGPLSGKQSPILSETTLESSSNPSSNHSASNSTDDIFDGSPKPHKLDPEDFEMALVDALSKWNVRNEDQKEYDSSGSESEDENGMYSRNIHICIETILYILYIL